MSGYYAWTIYPISHGPGVLTPDQPTLSYTAWEKPFNLKGNTLEPVKGYSAEVRILKHKRYFFDERKDLSPVDVVVGWNEMSDERNLRFVQFSISNRSFDLNYTKPPIPARSMYEQMELIHLIPSTKEIESDINWLRAGSIVRFEGKLVNVESGNNFNWNSDYLESQNDRSKKLILWVESLEIL
jgi:hypothetical protein